MAGSNMSWMIVYEPADALRFNAQPEIYERIIASAPIVSPMNFSHAPTSQSRPYQHLMLSAAASSNPNAAVSTNAANGDERGFQMQLLQALLVFANYAIVLPMFLLCWLAIVRWLRHTGYITDANKHVIENQQQAAIDEANRVSSHIAIGIPEPMRSAVAASIAIPMLVSAESSQKHGREEESGNSGRTMKE
uniref:RSN1_TM domain-containing protein n=1 Tax=Globodera pallida TaxID=36090 RepID=A0A183BJ96_GLOPA